ncbi:MAG: outer membrane protein assembly factor BamD [Gemmatimonadetes bacterium]|nr:outer membrane protein assembly factor BamD [Gemmatimonadota bacterium]
MHLRDIRSFAAFLLLGVSACRSAPPYQGMEAADIHALAERQFQAGDHNEVQRALNRLFIAFPSYPRTPEARLLLADSYYADKQYITAASEYRRFIDRYPGDTRAPIAAIGLCHSSAATSPEIQRDQSPTEDAEVVCRNIAADYPGTPQAEEAKGIADQMRLKLAEKIYTVAEYYYRRKFWDSSVMYWEMIENDYADTAWAPRALLGIMQAYDKIGYQDLVAETRKKILDSYPTSPEAQGLASDTTAAPVRTGGGR